MTAFASLLLMSVAAPGDIDKTGTVELFAAEPWYKEQAGKEQEFVGVLRKAERKGGAIGFGRFNPYRLDMDKDVREVYIGGKPAILGPYVGKKVKLVGKAVDLGVEGKKHREIWPASLVVLEEGKGGAKTDGAERILARARWVYASADPGKREKASQFVIRSAAELITRPPWNNLDAPPPAVEKTATAALAKALKVETIDWKTQMLVVVTGGTQSSGGFRIGVTSIQPKGDKLLVEWFLQRPKGFATAAFTHPAEVVLTPRFEGAVEFQNVPAPPAPGRD